MNFQIIAIYTVLSISLGVIQGILVGLWFGYDEQILASPIYHLLSYVSAFLVSVCIYYSLFKVRLKQPVLHALTIGALSQILPLFAIYLWVGLVAPSLLVFVGAMILVLEIALAHHLCRARGQFGIRA